MSYLNPYHTITIRHRSLTNLLPFVDAVVSVSSGNATLHHGAALRARMYLYTTKIGIHV